MVIHQSIRARARVSSRAVGASLVAVSLLVVSFFVGLVGCATTNGYRSGDGTLAVQHAPAVDRYLSQVESQLTSRWALAVASLGDVRKQGEGPKDAAGRAPQQATFEISLDELGQHPQLKHAQASHWHLFDYHARNLLTAVRWPPAPPVGEHRLVLSWRFFEDARGCARRFVTVRRVPLTAKAALRRALALRDTARALILVQKDPQPAVVAVLVAHGLADARPAVRAMALRIADAATLERHLRDHRADFARWQAALAEVLRRKQAALLSRVLTHLSRPLYGWHPATGPERTAQERRVGALIKAARRVRLAIPPAALSYALKSPLASTFHAALPSVADAGRLLTILEARQLDRDPRGVRALVRVLAAAGAKSADRRAVAHLTKQLRGKASGARGDLSLRRILLEALVRWPVAALRQTLLDAELATPLERALRLRALARIGGDSRPLYRNLESKQTLVRLAAIEELGRYPGSGLGASYRLVTLAYHAPEPFRSAAIVALVRIAHPRLSKDLEFLVRRLPAASKKALVPTLIKLGERGKAGLALLHVEPTSQQTQHKTVPQLSRQETLERLVRSLTTKDQNTSTTAAG